MGKLGTHIKEHEMLGILDEEEIASGFLTLDQTTPQTVDNGSPLFNEGITIKAGQKLYLDG